MGKTFEAIIPKRVIRENAFQETVIPEKTVLGFEVLGTKCLTAEEYLKYKDILLQSNKGFYNLISSSIYSSSKFASFNAYIGYSTYQPIGAVLGYDIFFAPAIIFKSDFSIDVGETISTRDHNFLVLDNNLAIYCDCKKFAALTTCVHAEIYAKSKIKYTLDRWTERLFDGTREMPSKKEIQDWFLNAPQPQPETIFSKEQTSEPYIEIDEYRTLNRYIPAIGETEVVLPEGIEAIRAEAFSLNEHEKAKIKSIHLPRTLKYIEEGTLCDINELETITVHPHNVVYKVVDGVLFACKDVGYYSWVSDKKCYLEPSNLICYPSQKKDVTEYTVPAWIWIKKGAFSGCQLECITIEADKDAQFGSNSIEDYAFKNSKKLHTVNLINPPKITLYGPHIFEGCNLGLRVNYNKRVTYLIPEGLISKNGKEIFYPACLDDEWQCPASVEKLSSNIAFHGVRKIVLSDSCEFNIHSLTNKFTFAHTKSIEEIHFGKSITSLFTDYLFSGCENLKIISGESLEAIGGDHLGNAFSGCNKLERIIPGPNCVFSSWEKQWPKNVIIEAPKGSATIRNAKKAGLKYKEV